MTARELIQKEYSAAKDKAAYVNDLKEWMHEHVTPAPMHPVDLVRWVPVESVQANDYNPNSVAGNEMRLLHTSISHDGYTQPIVTIWDDALKKYIVVDGFHRYTIMRNFPDIQATTKGLLPVVVLKKSINDRMASTIRHNRARGKHSVAGMGSMVFNLLQNQWGDAQICQELGLEPDELLRLKHVTGFSKLFKDAEYKAAWTTPEQIKIKQEFKTGKLTNHAKRQNS